MNSFLKSCGLIVLILFGVGVLGVAIHAADDDGPESSEKAVALTAKPNLQAELDALDRDPASLTQACNLKKTGVACTQASECCSQLCISGQCDNRRFDQVRRDQQLNCGLPGENCSNGSQCCSNRCDSNSKCAGGSTQGITCAYADQYCGDNFDCCSGKCDRNRSRCQADGIRECSAVGKTCGEDSECCSHSCRNVNGKKLCLGTAQDPARIYEYCSSINECFLGGQCVQNRCLPR